MTVISLVVEGLAVGSIYSLVAVGFVMLFNATGTVNFAQGDFMMFSTFVAYALVVQLGLPFLIAIPATLLFAAVLGAVVERVIIHRMIDAPKYLVIIASIGFVYILQGAAGMIWSDDVFKFPTLFAGPNIELGAVILARQQIGIILSAIVIITILFAFLNYTKVGTGLRALTQNKTAATLMGIRAKPMYALTWALGIMLAAIAGILLAPTLFLSTNMGAITFTTIIAAVMGGIYNIYGAVIGGYVIGIFQTVLPLYIPTELQGVIPFAVLMLVLFIKPTGLLGKKTVKKV
jgi:branched-chain amino acid transport system permease protein